MIMRSNTKQYRAGRLSRHTCSYFASDNVARNRGKRNLLNRNLVLSLITILGFYPIAVFSLGDLMLTEQQRKQLDALREGKHIVNTAKPSTNSTALPKKATRPIKVNGFYYSEGERHAPRLWVNGAQKTDKNISPSITVRGIDHDKKTVRLKTGSDSQVPNSIKAGQVLDVDKGRVKSAYE